MVLAVLRLKENNVKDLQRKRPFDGRPILRLNSLFDSTILKIPEIGFILCFCIQTSGLEYFGNKSVDRLLFYFRIKTPTSRNVMNFMLALLKTLSKCSHLEIIEFRFKCLFHLFLILICR